MTSEAPETRPPCFADLQKVFPMGADGLRHSPAGCMDCPEKTACLRAAVAGVKGTAFKQERVDQAYESGRMGFLSRWSRKKHLARQQAALKKKTNPDHTGDG